MASTYLTSEGFRELSEELEQLRTHKRAEVADRLHKALEDGESEENVEYTAAKQEQSFVEGRIEALELILAGASIIKKKPRRERGVVEVGSKVVVQEQGIEPETYFIVGAPEADPQAGRISNESPLGKALLERRVGEELDVEAPAGTYRVKILEVE